VERRRFGGCGDLLKDAPVASLVAVSEGGNCCRVPRTKVVAVGSSRRFRVCAGWACIRSPLLVCCRHARLAGGAGGAGGDAGGGWEAPLRATRAREEGSAASPSSRNLSGTCGVRRLRITSALCGVGEVASGAILFLVVRRVSPRFAREARCVAMQGGPSWGGRAAPAGLVAAASGGDEADMLRLHAVGDVPRFFFWPGRAAPRG
jgi:hypothetical protein